MSEKIEIQVARDRRTGFPSVRLNDQENFVALFPVTKLQIEQWLSEGGLSTQADPLAATQLIERMELHQVPSKYPDNVKKLSRVPISKCKPENLPSLLATGMTLWNTPEEIQNPKVKFPTPITRA